MIASFPKLADTSARVFLFLDISSAGEVWGQEFEWSSTPILPDRRIPGFSPQDARNTQPTKKSIQPLFDAASQFQAFMQK
jgi:hypothetical protein